MTPSTAQPGASLKGAALYLLHDKRSERQAAFNETGNPDRDVWGLQTTKRVAFVETENLPTSDPRLAVACMIDTAKHAADLKRANGMAGRTVNKPSYHYSLSWPYEQGQEPPDKAEMLRCARETLALQGLTDHQAMIIAHTDEKHPHVHVLVNLVHPETGVRNNLSNNHTKLSRWAQAYEEKQGMIVCPQRVENNARRDKGEFVKYDAIPRAEYERRKTQEKNKLKSPALNLMPPSMLKQELKAHWNEFRRVRDQKWRQIRAEQKPEWSDLYKGQREELKGFDRNFVSRLKVALKLNKGGGVMGAAMKALFGSYGLRRELVKRHEQDRDQLSQRLGRSRDHALDQVYQDYRRSGDRIFEQHRELRRQQREEAQHQKEERRTMNQERAQERPTPQQTPFPRRDSLEERGVGKSDALPEKVPDQENQQQRPPDQNSAKGAFDRAANPPAPPQASEKSEEEMKREQLAAQTKRKRNRSKQRKPRDRGRRRSE